MARRNRKRRGRHQAGALVSTNRESNLLQEPNDMHVVETLMFNIYRLLGDELQPPQYRQQGTSFEIRSILSAYSQLVESRPFRFSPNAPFRSFVLYSAAYLCYNWDIEDNNTVSWLLILIERSCGHFMALFQKALPHPIWDINPIPQENLPHQSTSRMSPFIYFAQHANRAKLQFHGVRFVDLRMDHPNGFRPSPVYWAASLGEVELLRLLLQLGADVGPTEQELQQSTWRAPWIISMINKLLSKALRAGVLQRISESEIVDDTSFLGGRHILCLRLLLRAVPQLQIGWFDYRQDIFWRTVFKTSMEMVKTMTASGLVPMFCKRCLEPPELKHLSRIAVRKILRMNWRLPDGVSQLEVPHALVDYLNLNED